jgi:hypothetical protein
MKHFNGGARYKSLGTTVLVAGCFECGYEVLGSKKDSRLLDQVTDYQFLARSLLQ